MDINHVKNLVSYAKIRLFNQSGMAFTSSLCSMLETVITDEVPYGATNGKQLLINPKTFMELTDNEQVFLLAHETLHVAYIHTLRRDDRDHQIFNMACDYVINLELVNQGMTMIQGVLLDRKYHGMSSEEVYDLLIKDNKPKPNNPLGDDIIPSDETATEEITGKIIQAVHQAQRSNNYGSVPDGVKRYIENLHKPKINWKAVLKRFMLNAGKADYSWKKPRKKLLNQGFYLPSINSFGLSKVTFAIDTSGSVDDEMFGQFISEIHHVFKQLNPDSIDLMLFDTSVKVHKPIKSINELKKVELIGCGGTKLVDTLEKYKKTDSKALIVITDGYFNTRLVNPKKPVLWVIFDNPQFTAPFGKVIHFKLE
ncbi:DUF2201 family putative metallopeptidase [Moraxella bovis]|uniref:VWA-like domain-containing protein n=1 Tax=Moraxella bovis TaxID=476 RepID=A0ABY6M5Y4_MORBO|nr:VWA-like domain-containing protein [Moraxella bovis]UZA02945.1 VWA-like domain-containing protein [Moraxella bovis]UZA19156.1 VWA-like domain-containing protein [Moraxella bovis]UZA54038.1 VWA-like domain-containing protein [Moraxella bovis]UZA57356.1 VWA-like domain-containing protein [Moraxella bovis]